MNAPVWLYLHGFASSPESKKARAIATHYEAKGISIERLDMRQPSFEELRLSEMIAHVRSYIGGIRDRAVVIGSSLGGLTACRLAESDPRVASLVLLAPAFRMIERMRTRIGEAAWRQWQSTGWHETMDYAKNAMGRVDFGFAEDAARADAAGGGWPDVRVPTLIVHGAKDETVDIQLSRAWAHGKRHVRLVEVDDGHELGLSLDRIVKEADCHLASFFSGNLLDA